MNYAIHFNTGDSYQRHTTAIISLCRVPFLSVAIAVNGSYFGQGGGSTWLGDLECNGTEASLVDCLTVEQQRHAWQALQCNSAASILCLGQFLCRVTNKDAIVYKLMPNRFVSTNFIMCRLSLMYKSFIVTFLHIRILVTHCKYDAAHTETDNGQSIRLVGGRTGREGRVEVFYEGVWGSVCGGSQWGMREAETVCKELGFFDNSELSLSCTKIF